MYYKKNKDNEIIETISDIPEEDKKNWLYTDEKIVYFYPLQKQMLLSETLTEKNQKLQAQYEGDKKIEDLRDKRERECFFIINRGSLWYDNLTETQKVELSIWYKEWLNVTKTLEEPIKPTWLK